MENLGFQKNTTIDIEIGNGYLIKDGLWKKEVHSTQTPPNLLS
jgi:hypothetical protein